MKKALILTLTMACALPISSLNAAGWRDYIPSLPSLPSWQAQPEPSGVPAFPESASQEYKDTAQQVMNDLSAIKTEEKKQNLVESAKKWGLRTLACPAFGALCYFTLAHEPKNIVESFYCTSS